MSRTDPELRVRIPEALKARVEASAKENSRTVTAEVVARLDASYEPAASSALLEALHGQIAALRRADQLMTVAARSMAQKAIAVCQMLRATNAVLSDDAEAELRNMEGGAMMIIEYATPLVGDVDGIDHKPE